MPLFEDVLIAGSFPWCIRLDHTRLSVFHSKYRTNCSIKRRTTRHRKNVTGYLDEANNRENESRFPIIIQFFFKRAKIQNCFCQGQIYIPIIVVTDEMIAHTSFEYHLFNWLASSGMYNDQANNNRRFVSLLYSNQCCCVGTATHSICHLD